MSRSNLESRGAAAPDSRIRLRTLFAVPMTTAELRERCQAFYEERGHLRVPSHSLIPPPDDRSTLFIVAGMQQFKPYSCAHGNRRATAS